MLCTHVCNTMAESKETVMLSTFKKWPFSDDFNVDTSDGKVVSVMCKYCSEIDYNAFLREARYHNIKGSALKSIENYRKKVTYIHRSSFARHVGDSNSFHNWCKNKLLPDANSSDSTPSTSQQPTASLPAGQKSVDTMIIDNSSNYYKVLFRSVLFLLEEEMAFTKMPRLVKLQKDSGLKLSYNDKLNTKAAVEMAEILCDVIMSKVRDFCSKSNFFTLTADASEARKR